MSGLKLVGVLLITSICCSAQSLLSLPDGQTRWPITDSCQSARGISGKTAQEITAQVSDADRSGWIWFKNFQEVAVDRRGVFCSHVTLSSGDSGFVESSLLGFTLSEQRAIDAAEPKVEDKRRAAARAARNAEGTAILQKAKKDCAAAYAATSDKKTSDLTAGEAEMVSSCRSIKMYPPPAK
jgi:hypothetical protein